MIEAQTEIIELTTFCPWNILYESINTIINSFLNITWHCLSPIIKSIYRIQYIV